MMRLKRPAYAKPLLAQRRAGNHPREITLIYGEKWREGDPPRICIRPEEYAPGAYDLSVFAGVKVTLLDQNLASENDQDDKFFDLIGELVRLKCPVQIVPPAGSGLSPQWTSDMAWGRRVKRQFPRWWSDDLQSLHERSFYAWIGDDIANIERERGRAA